MEKLYEKYLKEYAEKLIKGGHEAIKNAYINRRFKNRTFNLHDSYGSCLFVNGREYPNSRRYVGRNALVGKKDPQGQLILGRGEIDKFFDSYHANPRKIQLVVAVAIFYASILGERWKVFSGAYTEMERLSQDVGGFLTKIHTEQ